MAQRQILIVDSRESGRQELDMVLGSQYTVVTSAGGADAVAVLMRQYKVTSAVLLDVSQPASGGYDVLKAMHSNPSLAQIPAVAMADSYDLAAQKRALQSGATDYIIRPVDAEVLRLRLANLIRLRESSALANSLRKDKLTGLLTRDAFFSQVERCVSSHEPGYYIMSAFDIDKFSAINDLYGSAKGDEVLRSVGNAIAATVRSLGGFASRLNADNFALIYPADMLNSSTITENHIAASVGDGSIPPVRFSIGRYVADDLSIPATAMYDRALMAKTSVKGHYGEHIAMYDESMRQRLLNTEQIVDDMRPAIAEHEFEAWFQPQYNNITGAMIGAEALARWRHPKRGLVSPAEFIPVFENNGFIYELDKSIWEQSCAFIRRCLDEGGEALPVSVNVSRYDILREDVCEVLTGLTKKYSLPVELLRLEITESVFSNDPDQIIAVVKRLVELGFVVEIDDFGSGYSSLNTLKDVPAQIIKLDMRFLEASNNLERGGSIIESVIRMARWLGMAVIAEGVETVQQARYLKSIGCSYSQGWFFAKAMPGDEYFELIRRSKKESKLLALRTVEHLDNNSFWDPESMDSLIFNSFVGAACILEFVRGQIVMLRMTDAFTKMLESRGLIMDEAMNIDWGRYMDARSLISFSDALMESLETKDTVVREYEFQNLPGCTESVSLRCFQRVIAMVEDRYMVYSINEDITAQREAERQSRETGERMRAVMANISSGICAAVSENGKYKILFANDQCFSIFGYTREQYETELENGVRDLILPEDLEQACEKHRQFLSTGEETTTELRVRRRDGSVIWLSVRGSLCSFNGSRQPVDLAVYTDITQERLNAKKAVDAERLQSIMSNVNGGMAAMTIRDGRPEYIFFNDQYCDMIGYTREQFTGELRYGINSCIPPEDEARVAAAAVAAELGGKNSVIEFPVRCRNGRLIWLRAHNSVNKMESYGRPVHISVVNDITLEREAQQHIRALNENLQTMMADIPGGYARIRVMPDGRLDPIYLNNGFYKLVGMSAREVAKLYDGDAMAGVHPDDMDAARAAVEEMLTKGECRSARYRLAHGACGYVWVAISGRRTSAPEGSQYLNIYYSEPGEQERRDLNIREILPFILSATMAESTDIVFTKDKELRYIFCSPAFLRFAGKEDVSEIVGKTDFELFPEETAAQYRYDDRLLLSSGRALTDRLEPIPSNDGIQHFASISKFILHDSSGGVLGVYGHGRDITDIRQAYKQLSLLSDSIPGGLATYIISGGDVSISYYNDGFCRMLGCTREQYAAWVEESGSVMERVHPDDRDALIRHIRALYADGRDIDVTYRCEKLDGSGWAWINLRGALAERRGEIVTANAVLYDVTAEREAERQIMDADEKLRFLNDASRHIMMNPEVDSSIDVMLEKLLEHFDASRAYVFEKNYSANTSSNTYEVCAEGVEPEMERLQELPNEVGGAWFDIFASGDIVSIRDVSLLGDDRSAERQLLLEQGIKSLIAVPFYRNGRLIGFLGVDDPKENMDHVEQLRALGDYLAVMLMRRDHTRQAQSDQQALRELMDDTPGGFSRLQLMPNGVWAIDYINKGFCNMLGRRLEEVIATEGEDATRLVHPDDVQLLRENVKRSLETGEACRLSCRLRNGAGEYVRFSVFWRVSHGEKGGAFLNVYYTRPDRREEQSIRERLSISEEEYRVALDSCGRHIYRYDHRDDSVDLSESVAALFGLERHIAAVPDGLLKNGIVAKESVSQYKAFFRAIKRGDKTGSMTICRRISDGSWHWFHANFSTVFDEDGRPSSAIVVFYDATEQREKEAIYQKWQQSIEERADEDYTFFRWNLSRDKPINGMEGKLLKYAVPRNGRFDDLTEDFARKRVYPEDRAEYTAFLNVGSMLAGYYHGMRFDRLEFRELSGEGGAPRWLRLLVELVEYPNSSDVCAFLMYENVDAEKREELLIREKAELDPLTGVLNRATFAARSEQRCLGLGKPCALMMMDIDGIKNLNDTLGHATGDQALVEIAAALRSVLRPDDLLGRLGGDEFLILLKGISRDADIERKARQVCDLLRKDYSPGVPVSASIGVAVCPRDGADFDTLYRKVDAALYSVKRSGKDNYALYSEQMPL